ncbi:MAG: hypothetical protein H6622_05545 [Halobacteriovoraceae bacterium]|nr:hypothetical protein [Halobacteriovoraceae bacterium]
MVKTFLMATLMISTLAFNSCSHYGRKHCGCKEQCSMDKKQCKMKDKSKCGGGAGEHHGQEEDKKPE